VTKTTVSTDLLQPFDIVTKFSIDVLCKDLHVLSGLEILLPIQEPEWDLELPGVLDDSNEFFDLIGGKFTSTFVDIDFSLLTDQVSETTSKTLNFCKAENNIPLSLDVSVENTKNVLEFSTLH
jgi:hypothetical protein